ncbi:MAG: biopolymer transporter ExbD [Bacteroidaceae bacterium]|nr:biopolymer transporter ExbD [Bacteroidaceae bacterium]
MLFKKNFSSHEIPELNTTSTADISFMLLILFLVTTSMDRNFGLPYQLSKPAPKHLEHIEKVVDRRNVFEIDLTADGKIIHNDEEVEADKLCAMMKEFIVNPKHDETLSESPAKHIILINADDNSKYESYFAVENQIVNAYKQLRNEASRKRFGKPYDALNDRQLQVIDEAIPQRVSEK